MPITVDFTANAVTVTATGALTYQEVADLIAHQIKAPARTPGLPILVDARDVNGAPSTAELRLIAAEMRPLIETGMGPVGILTGSTFVYGIARMFSVFAQALCADVSAFRCPADAENWLETRRTAA